jgi:entry exclusion lipoprotein TrbK
MKTYKTPHLALAALIVALIVGCGEKAVEPPTTQALPEANDKNCTAETTEKLKDKAAQQEFSDRCFRRGTFKPSPKREW